MTLAEYFEQTYNSDELNKFLSLVGAKQKPTQKVQRITALIDILTSPADIKRLWQQMDDISRKALASAYHNDGFFVADAFIAQYGALPSRPKKAGWGGYGEAILLDVLLRGASRYSRLSHAQIHPELMPLLAPLMPPPDRFQLTGLTDTPIQVQLNARTFDLYLLESETTGLHDLLLYLTLLNNGEIAIRSKGQQLTAKSVETLRKALLSADATAAQHVAVSIRLTGLPIFAAESGLTRYDGRLTERGKHYLATEDPEILLESFTQWSEEGTFDELSRIDAIKGVRFKGLRLTPPASRRERIIEALSWAPTGVWISVFDFYRALKIWHLDFDLEEGGPEKLYVGYQYRSAGYSQPWADAGAMWMLTNGLYINAVLWEYLATIGAIDLLFSGDPYFFPADTYYGDPERPLSDHDGLCFFRINRLGGYLFGQSEGYTPARSAEEPLFTVDAAGTIILLDAGHLSLPHRAQIEQLAEPSGEGYRLSTQKLLDILETAPDLDLPRAFLAQRNRGPLPVEVMDFLARVEEDSKALKTKNRMLAITVRSAELAQRILADPGAGKMAQQLDARTLIIPESRKTAFRNALRAMGYGLRES